MKQRTQNRNRVGRKECKRYSDQNHQLRCVMLSLMVLRRTLLRFPRCLGNPYRNKRLKHWVNPSRLQLLLHLSENRARSIPISLVLPPTPDWRFQTPLCQQNNHFILIHSHLPFRHRLSPIGQMTSPFYRLSRRRCLDIPRA